MRAEQSARERPDINTKKEDTMSYVDNLKTFVKIYEHGSISAAARHLGVSPAVASSRLVLLESQANARLFARTTRSLNPTEQGTIFYNGSLKILADIEKMNADIANVTNSLKGTILVGAPLGIGRKLIAPEIPKFHDKNPDINIRLRLSDRSMDPVQEGLDLVFMLGFPKDSSLQVKEIGQCTRVLCASPKYIERYGNPRNADEIVDKNHQCLLLRFPGISEFQWLLRTDSGIKRFSVSGCMECDDGDVLTSWALHGEGIINKPVFEIYSHLKSGALVPVATETPPAPIHLSCLHTHRNYQDPKNRTFMDAVSKSLSRTLAKKNDVSMEESAPSVN